MGELKLPEQIGKPPVENAIVFIHGLNGNETTWKKFSNCLNDNWDIEDCYDLEYESYTVELGIIKNIPLINTLYRGIKGGPKVIELSNHLSNTIDEICRSHKRVILVAHSMGGLIARQYLIDTIRNTKTTGKVKCLFTYATPHYGSKLATFYKWLVKPIFTPLHFIWGSGNSKQIVDMCRSNSEFLDNLNKDWNKLGLNNKIDFYRVFGGYDWVVDKRSASMKDATNKNAKLVSSKDHFNIIKPNNKKDRAFIPFYNYLKEFKKNYEKEEILEDDNYYDEIL
jgi:hypothetical protein